MSSEENIRYARKQWDKKIQELMNLKGQHVNLRYEADVLTAAMSRDADADEVQEKLDTISEKIDQINEWLPIADEVRTLAKQSGNDSGFGNIDKQIKNQETGKKQALDAKSLALDYIRRAK